MKRVDRSGPFLYGRGSFHHKRIPTPDECRRTPKKTTIKTINMPQDSDIGSTLAQFNLLIEQILAGEVGRSRYQPWEIDLLLDIESCNLNGAAVAPILRQYQKAVRDEMENGAGVPLTLSQYLRAW